MVCSCGDYECCCSEICSCQAAKCFCKICYYNRFRLECAFKGCEAVPQFEHDKNIDGRKNIPAKNDVEDKIRKNSLPLPPKKRLSYNSKQARESLSQNNKHNPSNEDEDDEFLARYYEAVLRIIVSQGLRSSGSFNNIPDINLEELENISSRSTFASSIERKVNESPAKSFQDENPQVRKRRQRQNACLQETERSAAKRNKLQLFSSEIESQDLDRDNGRSTSIEELDVCGTDNATSETNPHLPVTDRDGENPAKLWREFFRNNGQNSSYSTQNVCSQSLKDTEMSYKIEQVSPEEETRKVTPFSKPLVAKGDLETLEQDYNTPDDTSSDGLAEEDIDNENSSLYSTQEQVKPARNESLELPNIYAPNEPINSTEIKNGSNKLGFSLSEEVFQNLDSFNQMEDFMENNKMEHASLFSSVTGNGNNSFPCDSQGQKLTASMCLSMLNTMRDLQQDEMENSQISTHLPSSSKRLGNSKQVDVFPDLSIPGCSKYDVGCRDPSAMRNFQNIENGKNSPMSTHVPSSSNLPGTSKQVDVFPDHSIPGCSKDYTGSRGSVIVQNPQKNEMKKKSVIIKCFPSSSNYPGTSRQVSYSDRPGCSKDYDY